MFGMNKGMADMLTNMLGISPEELQAQAQNAIAQMQAAKDEAEKVARIIVNNQNIIYHKLMRVEKMMESILRERGIELPNDEASENGPGTGKQLNGHH